MDRFKFKKLPIKDVFEILQSPIEDKRGYLIRLFCFNELKNIGWSNQIAQINRTFTKKKGTIRGMHFQLPPTTESKIIICTKGIIFDVAVDVRKESKTYLDYVSLKLSSEINNMILIPKGFAHGFQTLSDDVELIYNSTTQLSSENSNKWIGYNASSGLYISDDFLKDEMIIVTNLMGQIIQKGSVSELNGTKFQTGMYIVSHQSGFSKIISE